MRGVGNETNAVRDIKKDVVLTRIAVHYSRIKNNAGGIAVAEIPEIGIPLGRSVLKIDSEVLTTLHIGAAEFSRWDELKIEFEHQVVAIAAVVGIGPSALRSREVGMATTTAAHRLIHHAIFIKARSAAVYMFLSDGAAQVGAVKQSVEVILQDHQIEIKTGGARLKSIGRNRHAAQWCGLQNIGPPTRNIDVATDIDQKGRR